MTNKIASSGNDLVDFTDLSVLSPNTVIPPERIHQDIKEVLTDIYKKEDAGELIDITTHIIYNLIYNNGLSPNTRPDKGLRDLVEEYKNDKAE